eukprot:7463742-Pyramimonas_sp.AAC.1
MGFWAAHELPGGQNCRPTFIAFQKHSPGSLGCPTRDGTRKKSLRTPPRTPGTPLESRRGTPETPGCPL